MVVVDRNREVTLARLTHRADPIRLNVKDLQIDGGPSGVRSDRYEMDARAEGAATFEQMRPMLQSLLADDSSSRCVGRQDIWPSISCWRLETA